MKYRITDFLDCLENAGQDLKPRGGNAARVGAMTFAKLRGVQELPPTRRRARPLAALLAAAAAVLLLGGSVFAAWKLGVFRFGDAMGSDGDKLDQYAVHYDAQESKPAVADQGYADWSKAQAAGYNLVLLELSVKDGQLYAEADVSPKDESLPPFRDSGLRLSFAGFETQTRLRKMDAWTDRATLTAELSEELPAGTELRFVFTGADSEAQTEAFLVGYSRYENPDAPAEYVPKLASAAETKDYRFSLQTLAVSESVVYAVIDVEALSDFGMKHLDVCPEFALSNRSSPGTSILLDARLMESGEGVRRYLMGTLRRVGQNAVGDLITIELLELLEEGDMAGHPYLLFDVQVEQLLPGAVTMERYTGQPVTETVWQRLTLDPLGLRLEGSVAPDAGWPPELVLLFKDGTRETVLDADNSYYGAQAPMPEGHRAVLVNAGGTRGGMDYLSLLFARPIELEQLEGVLVNGQLFQIDPD